MYLSYSQKKGLRHTVEVYGAVINSFLSKSDVKSAQEYFDLMKQVGIKPNVIIYTLMITAYGRVLRITFLVFL